MLFEKTHAKITALYFVPCVVHSCNKLHATRELVNRVPWLNLSCYEGIANHVSEFIIRATSCTLRGNRESRIEVESFVHQDARYEGIMNHVSRLIHSCNKLHATRESVNRVPGLNHSCNKLHAPRCKRCTLRALYKTLPLRIKKARHFHVVLFC